VAALTENVSSDFPSFAARIASTLSRLIGRRRDSTTSTATAPFLSYHLVATAAFFAQVSILFEPLFRMKSF
jgi:hypothetical protein